MKFREWIQTDVSLRTEILFNLVDEPNLANSFPKVRMFESFAANREGNWKKKNLQTKVLQKSLNS